MTRKVTNVAASVRARLTNLAKIEGKTVQSTFLRYAQERFLYRLASSTHVENFILKGGLLLYGVHGFRNRPTVDIDLLGRGVSEERLADLVRAVASVPVDPDDGVVFFPDSVATEPITAQTEYGGVRVHVDCTLEKARMTLQIDIGFGDAIVPRAVEVDFPGLLGGQPARLLAYSLDSAVAEKFEAMIRFGLSNSRLKDFYDIYTISGEHDFDGRVLQEAILQTFDRRGTPRERDILLFGTDFAHDRLMHRQWELFLKRFRKTGDENPDFPEVMARIREFLEPVYQAICLEQEYFGRWGSKGTKWSPYQGTK